MNEKVLRKLEYNKIINKLVNCTISPMGKEISTKLIPLTDIEQIKLCQKETAEAVSMILKKGSIPLGGIKDIRAALKRTAIGATLSIAELLYIGETLRVAKKVKLYAKDDREKITFEILEGLFESLQPLSNIQREISSCIVSEEEIYDNASATLKNIRKEIKISHEKIKQSLHKIIHSNTYKNMLQDTVITMRDDRYCIPLKQEYRGGFKGMIHDQSSTGSTLFIEPMAVIQLNNHLKELAAKEKAEIEKILKDLSILVAGYYEEIKTTIEVLTQLDFIFAKGQLALSMNATEPIFNDKGYIKIKKGRHPLLDKDKVVPIDVYLGKSFTTLVITGPNTGGKTVTLKTIGLFALMGQAGLHIPAFDRSELAVFRNVFADIGDEQSIEQSLSTFSSHMVNIVNILDEVDDDSLVLFDELGAGTDPTEGAALAMAILQILHKRKIRTAATTHYSELKVYALSTEGVENASCEFDVETLRPTYKLLIGIPGKSNAFAISKRLGLKEEIINQAKDLLEHNDIRFEDIITDLEISKKTVQYEQERAMKYRKEAQEIKSKVEAQKQKIESQKQKIIREAREEARKILQNAKDESDRVVKQLNKVVKENQKALNFKEIEKQRNHLREKLDDIEQDLTQNFMAKKTVNKIPKKLKLGDKVFVSSFGKEGIVLSEPDSKGNVMIQAGIMKMKVNIKDLSLIKGKNNISAKPYNMRKTKGEITKSQTISTEIDVRGKMVEEAIGEIDKYIDDAYLANLSKVTLIHGKGTGALRMAVHKYLKRNNHIKSFRLGKYGEGETGVTIVELKNS